MVSGCNNKVAEHKVYTSIVCSFLILCLCAFGVINLCKGKPQTLEDRKQRRAGATGIRERGGEPDEVFVEIAEERKTLNKLGIPEPVETNKTVTKTDNKKETDKNE